MSDQPSRWASQRIAEDLEARIRSGEYKPKARLPSERSLAASERVARNTARAALELLERRGLIDIVHGSGAFVREPVSLIRLGGQRYSRALREETGLSPFRAELLKQNRKGHSDCTRVERVRPPAEIAQRLGLPATTKSVVVRENWYYVEDQPVQVCWTYIPVDIAKGTVLARNGDLGRGSIYARLEDAGHPIASYRDEVVARMPTNEEVLGLRIPVSVPVLDLVHTSIDADGRPFEVTHFVMRADAVALDYTISNDL